MDTVGHPAETLGERLIRYANLIGSHVNERDDIARLAVAVVHLGPLRGPCCVLRLQQESIDQVDDLLDESRRRVGRRPRKSVREPVRGRLADRARIALTTALLHRIVDSLAQET